LEKLINDELYFGFVNTFDDEEKRQHYYKQYLKTGVDDTETWSLDGVLSSYLCVEFKKIKLLKELDIYPKCFETKDEWVKILDDVVKGFEIISSDVVVINEEQLDTISKSLELFTTWFFNRNIKKFFKYSIDWNIDVAFAMYFIPRLKRYIALVKKHKFYPGNLANHTQWLNMLKDILEGFELIAKDEELDSKQELFVELSLKLFKEKFRDLWW